jgi:ectoine hydroxylase-related dioxygenase (phytanoyl-CoA dioxygenase family)
MPKRLTARQVEQYREQGFTFPLRVLDREQARRHRNALEAYERSTGSPIRSEWRHKTHLLFTWANELVRHPVILDAVEDLMGPDIICWTTNFFIKEAHDPGFVSWHQDSTYWGLDPCDVLTAWLALSDAPVASGAMKMLPGSQRWEQVPHRDTYDEHNLLTRGQEIEVEVDETEGVHVPLEAGEISLHHVRIVHASAPNTTGDRRIGLAIRYVAPHVRQVKMRDSAMLVRGEDRFGHFDWEPQPVADLDEVALAAHHDATQRQVKVLYDDTRDRFRP